MSGEQDHAPRVLVVDDNKDAALTLGMIPEVAGYQVETYFDGPSALEAVDRFDPDVCVVDINLTGMDGYELARRLRQRVPGRARVLATVTANDGYGHLAEAADSGFDLHFTKPADPKELIIQMRNCLRNGNR